MFTPILRMNPRIFVTENTESKKRPREDRNPILGAFRFRNFSSAGHFPNACSVTSVTPLFSASLPFRFLTRIDHVTHVG